MERSFSTAFAMSGLGAGFKDASCCDEGILSEPVRKKKNAHWTTHSFRVPQWVLKRRLWPFLDNAPLSLVSRFYLFHFFSPIHSIDLPVDISPLPKALWGRKDRVLKQAVWHSNGRIADEYSCRSIYPWKVCLSCSQSERNFNRECNVRSLSIIPLMNAPILSLVSRPSMSLMKTAKPSTSPSVLVPRVHYFWQDA